MLKKLRSLYTNSVIYHEQPKYLSENEYLFWNETENEWISIPKSDLTEKELSLLKTLYTLVEIYFEAADSRTDSWKQFLLFDGPPPLLSHFRTSYRFIQFQIQGSHLQPLELETAFKGFFTEDVIIIWVSAQQGIVLEEKSQTSLPEEEWTAVTETLESDLYVNIRFFIGKLIPFTNNIKERFLQEKEFFEFGITSLPNLKVQTYEKVFPAYIAAHLPDELKQLINPDVLHLFQQDQELFSTIKVFLENSSNASFTAKKLFIHRNTLQYRIDKFTDQTGISLKDFYGAFTVFLSCLLFEQQL